MEHSRWQVARIESEGSGMFRKDRMFHRFALYGFLKNLKFFEPFIILFFREAELSFFQIGLLFSIRDLATNVLEVPTGVYADAFGRRRSMVMAFVSYIVSFIIFFGQLNQIDPESIRFTENI